MRDCVNAEMRDALPDLLNGTLPAERAAPVRAHLDSCADCRAELELLRQVRQAAVTPAIDVARIGAALPPYRRTPLWRRAASRGGVWRVAAAILLLAGGVQLAIDAPSPGLQIADTSRQAAPAAAELSYGGTLQDVSDAELDALVEALDTLDAVIHTEPEQIAVPLGASEDL